VNFRIDSGYACEIFQSCEKVSFIAQSDITSSEAFLDFLGVNGQNQSLSIITFDLTENNDKTSLVGEAYDCDFNVPSDGLLDSYD